MLCHVSRHGVEVGWLLPHVAGAAAILRALSEVACARRALTEVNQPRVPGHTRTGFVSEAGQPHVGAPAVHILLRSLARGLRGSSPRLSRTLCLHGDHLVLRRTSSLTRHLLRSGRGHPPLEAEALPAIDLRFVFTLQIHVVETCGLAVDLAWVTSLVTRALARLGQRLTRGRGGARGAGAVREAGVETSVAPGILE